MSLTPRRKRFVEVFAGNGTEAARLAGFTGDDATLAQTAHRLLRNGEVRAALKEREKEEVRPLVATRQERQAFWTAAMGGVLEQTLPDGSRMKLPVEMKDRLKASELLGRSEADFTDKVAGADGGPVQVVFNVNRGGKR